MRATRANAIRDALLPVLRRRFWEDGRLHHPLIIEEILNCEGANRANERYLQKMERLRELRTDPGDGSKYVWLHERAYRFGALRRIGPRLKEATHYWSLVGEYGLTAKAFTNILSDGSECGQTLGRTSGNA